MKRLDPVALATGILFVVIWSSAFSTSKIVVYSMPPLTALSVRFAISGLLGIGMALLLGGTLRLDPGQWPALILFGVFQNAVYLGLNFVALQWVEASVAVIIASSLPLIVALLSRIANNERLGALGVCGLAAGLLGVALVMGGRVSGGSSFLGISLCIIASVAAGAATLTMKSAFPRGGNLLMIVGLQMLVGCAVLAPPALMFETPSVDWSWEFGLAFAYTILFPGLVATWMWFKLVDRSGPTRAAAFHFLNPFFGVAIAGMLLGERMSPADLAGVAVISAGIVAVQLARQWSN